MLKCLEKSAKYSIFLKEELTCSILYRRHVNDTQQKQKQNKHRVNDGHC